MKHPLGWISGIVIAALATAHADEPTIPFNTEINCDIEAGYFEIYKSPQIDKFAQARKGYVSGAFIMDKAHRHEDWASSVVFGVENSATEVTEVYVSTCGRDQLCSQWQARRAGPDGKAKVLGGAEFGGPQPQGEWVSFRIDFTGPRQWLVQIGKDRQSLILPKDVTGFQVRCIGMTGRIRFDLGETIS